MVHITDFGFVLDEHPLKRFPGVVLMEAWLDVCVELVDGELTYHIDHVQLEKSDKTIERFGEGSWLFDALVPELYLDSDFEDRMWEQAREHM